MILYHEKVRKDHECFVMSQFNSAQRGTPVQYAGFCGLWSLKNAEILFSETYISETGVTYGSILLDTYPMVQHSAASLSSLSCT